MKRTRHTPEQIMGKLRQAEADLAGGLTIRSWASANRRTIAGASSTEA